MIFNYSVKPKEALAMWLERFKGGDEKMTDQEKEKKSIRQMALFIIVVCLAYMFMASFVTVPIQGKDYSTPIVAIIMLLIGYYWGSSSGSTSKSETIDKELLKPKPPEVKP